MSIKKQVNLARKIWDNYLRYKKEENENRELCECYYSYSLFPLYIRRELRKIEKNPQGLNAILLRT